MTVTKIKPLVDTNSLLAIESLFGRSHEDPWALRLACDFADVFIYADWFRFTFGSLQDAMTTADWTNTPALVRCLRQRDSVAVAPLMIRTDVPVSLHDDYLADAFHGFATWARNNRRALRQWLDTHNTASIRAMQEAQVTRRYYFNLDWLAHEHDLERFSRELQLQTCELLYAFDNLLRGPLYGRLTGSDQYYLNHPMRDVSLLPTFEAKPGPTPPVAASFRESMARMLGRLTFDEYCVMLHELRGEVRNRGIHNLGAGQVDREVLREIAVAVSLPSRLKEKDRIALFAGGIIGGLGAIASFGPAAAIAGAVVSVSMGLWNGKLPRSAGRVQWLRWALEWDLEKQAAGHSASRPP